MACPSPSSRIVAPSTGATRGDLAIEHIILFMRPGSKEGDPEAARSQESPKRGTQEEPQGGARRAQKEPWPTRSPRMQMHFSAMDGKYQEHYHDCDLPYVTKGVFNTPRYILDTPSKMEHLKTALLRQYLATCLTEKKINDRS